MTRCRVPLALPRRLLGAAMIGAAVGTSPCLAVGAAGDAPAPTAASRAAIAPNPAGTPAEARSASVDAGRLAAWVVAARDHGDADFLVVDKRTAKLLLFDAAGRVRASSAVLLGAALGDDSVPGIGLRPIAQVRPDERTTPAGRFVGERGRNAQGEDVVWIDYDAAVSMHRVRATNPVERRLERLATPGADDKRISYGCINVPAAFYDRWIKPAFEQRRTVVYVLPDTKPLAEVFATQARAARRADGTIGDTIRDTKAAAPRL